MSTTPGTMGGNRNFTTTPDDHSGIALTVTAVLGVFSIIFMAIRVYVRAEISGRFGWDDWLCAAATAAGIAQTIVTCASVWNGFGKNTKLLDDGQIVTVEKLAYVADILYVLTNCLAKCSVTMLLSLVKPDQRFRRGCWVLLGFCGTWGFASILAIALRCNLSHPWLVYQESCPNLFLRWQTITAFDIILEVTILIASVVLVFNVQLPISAKVIVVMGFILRLPVTAAAATRIHYIGETLKSSQPFLEGVTELICTQVEMHFALMAATIPSLKPFMSRFNTGWGTNAQSTHDYALDPYGSNKSNYVSAGSRSRERRGMTTQDSLRPDMTRRTTEVSKSWPIQEETRSTSPSSDETDNNGNNMVIKRTVSWEVIHEDDNKDTTTRPSNGSGDLGF